MPLLMDREEEGNMSPIIQTNGCTFMYIKHSNVYVVSTTSKNANVSLVFVFLHRLVQVFEHYFKELEEESLRDNFVIVYELLDELLDFGYPQTTDSKILQEYITQESHKLEVAPRPPMAVTNAVHWRSEGIKYRKNEVFLDVIESVNLLANSNGNVLRSEIVGSIKMRVYLSGMPNCGWASTTRSSSRARAGARASQWSWRIPSSTSASDSAGSRTIEPSPSSHRTVTSS